MSVTSRASLYMPFSVARVFNAMTDPSTYEKLPLVDQTSVVLAAPDGSFNGIGAIRELHIKGMVIQEQITGLEINQRMDYLFILWPLPLIHLGGSMIFTPYKKGTFVEWVSTIDSNQPLIQKTLPIIKLQADLGLKFMLYQFKKIIAAQEA
ncbi:SRPBCC family protein [Aquirhabdus parva]|uniref:SRPBCC family protein n=1 Tax=Aquirhabdus parva TaxID=2283318 RepID=A0A345PA36_9GAMM|nr:SRPBCC family protein [Aquirhabdus parva]AXI04145.1 hypothetical protein HYN46_15645 [Aquirhabdus parva]